MRKMLAALMVAGLMAGMTACSGGTDVETSDEIYDDIYENSTTEAIVYEEQEMPENEHIFVNEFASRPSQIVVENPTDTAYYMKFEDADGNTVFSFFVRPQSDTPMYMGVGTFYLKYAAGEKWYGEEHLFGEYTYYAKDTEPWEFTYESGWTLTMENQINGNVYTEAISPDEF